jgi:Uma2 family endonuclease
MATSIQPAPGVRTLGDLLEHLGGISADRVLYRPTPGEATEADVLELHRRENRLYELVEGVLVEKVMGYRESLLACAMVDFLRSFVMPRNHGLVSGADGMMRLFPGLVRIPDVAYASWDRVPGRRVPDVPLPHLVPDLAVEVLSAGNTEGEMTRKIGEYFAAGVLAVWLIDPVRRTVAVYLTPHQFTTLDQTQTLCGDPVLPGFALPLRELFAELDRQGNA